MTLINERRLDAIELITDGLSVAELDFLDGALAGTQVASKCVVADANVNTGISKITALHIGTSGSETQVTATGAELNYLDIVTLGTGANTKAVVLDAGDDYIWPATGVLTYGGTGITATGAEVNLLDGSLEANTAASVAPILDTAKALRTNANVGTAGTSVTAVEYGDGYNHVTVLTVTAAALAPTTVPADAEGIGAVVYTFPAGVYVGTAIHADLTAFTGTGLAATNAVDFGFGSLIASGDIATLTTAAMEDWLTGQTIADISSPATEKSTIMTGGAPLLFEAGDSHVLNLNMAGTWNDTFTDPLATATVVIHWTYLGA